MCQSTVRACATIVATVENAVPGTEQIGRLLLIAGGAIFLLGLVFLVGSKVPFLGQLPGDVRIERENTSCFVPLASSLLISLLLTFVLNLVIRLLHK